LAARAAAADAATAWAARVAADNATAARDAGRVAAGAVRRWRVSGGCSAVDGAVGCTSAAARGASGGESGGPGSGGEGGDDDDATASVGEGRRWVGGIAEGALPATTCPGPGSSTCDGLVQEAHAGELVRIQARVQPPPEQRRPRARLQQAPTTQVDTQPVRSEHSGRPPHQQQARLGTRRRRGPSRRRHAPVRARRRPSGRGRRLRSRRRSRHVEGRLQVHRGG